jgi:penicillin-binding protein 2
MARHMPFDWQQFHAEEHATPTVVDPRRRLRLCLLGFIALLFLIFARAVQLEVTQGAGFRAEAMRPVEKKTLLPAPRGRILARDGTVLACDKNISAVAVHYRWLQDPPDERWLLTNARSKLSKADRKNPQRLAEARNEVLAEREQFAECLAQWCGLSAEQWANRARRIQSRVEQISENANRHEQTEHERTIDADESWAVWARRLLLEDPPPPKIVVAEELDYHVMAEAVVPDVAEKIKKYADQCPGVKVIELSQRSYPNGSMAAHVIGHLGPIDQKQLAEQEEDHRTYLPSDWVGRMGVERRYENVLRGRRGEAIVQTDHSGRVLMQYERVKPLPGEDVVLALHPALQQTAETLLQSALERQAVVGAVDSAAKNDSAKSTDPAGGAIAVMNIEDGAILAAASAPRFDPNIFIGKNRERLNGVLADPSHPLFDRVCSMAIPPGSTFKTLTAIALLSTSQGNELPNETIHCRGYLDRPDRQRCEIFVRHGIGHGEVTLTDALAVSCNVYFFHFAGLMGPRPLNDWASRFGFGHPTGVDLSGEAAGTLPCPENIRLLEGHSWRTVDTQMIAVGQGSLTATPLQVLCMMAAVANDGRLVTPHVVQASSRTPVSPPRSISGLQESTLQIVRQGLERVVADPNGTAHDTVFLDSVAIAGKTGTAETGDDRPSHAWFAGYSPAASPKLAFVVVLEHGGDAATAAGPVAKRLVLRMQQLGLVQ